MSDIQQILRHIDAWLEVKKVETAVCKYCEEIFEVSERADAQRIHCRKRRCVFLYDTERHRKKRVRHVKDNGK